MSTRRRLLCIGANGYLGSHIVCQGVQAGYTVRAAVRTREKAELWRAWNRDLDQSRIEWAIIPDMTHRQSFLDAVKGVDFVIHTASPVNYALREDVERSVIDPALDGTLAVLRAAAKEGSVKRVVLTSSMVAALPVNLIKAGNKVHDESDWSDATREQAVASKNGVLAYQVSKKLAEQAAWRFMREEKPNFDFTTLCPPMLYGPPAQPVHASMSNLNQSLKDVWGLVDMAKLPMSTPFPLYCDVRDIAKLHLLAAEKDAARGQRYLASAGSFRFARMAEAIRSDPEISSKNRERIPSSSGQRAAQHDIMVDTSRVERDLGIKWRPFELTVRDTARALFKLEETMNR